MRAILKKAIRELEAAGCETPRLDAEVLLAHVLGCGRFEIFTTGCQLAPQPGVPGGKIRLFKNFIERRKRREPVAYITGTKEFWSLPIKVTPDVLIPRPETEAVVEAALKVFRSTKYDVRSTILDLCAGSGCITAALAKEFPKAQITATDISEKALEIAKENLRFAGDRITFIQSDFFENIRGKFELIVSNPPYVASRDMKKLQPEIKNFEPRLALDGGPDGLDFIRRIRQDAPRYLKSNGWLILENGAEIQTWNASSLRAECPSTEVYASAAPKMPSSL